MSQTSWQKQQQPLDALQSMINGVLIETGKALRSANKKGVATIGRADNRLQLLLPNTHEKFHLALDELESDIVRAKAVLSRDLRDLQTKRNQLEHPTEQQVQDTTDTSEGERLIQASLDSKEILSPKAAFESQDFIKAEEIIADDASIKMAPSPKSRVESPPSPPPSPRNIPNEVQSHENPALEVNNMDDQGKVNPQLALPELSKTEGSQGVGMVTSDPDATVVIPEATETLELQSTNFDSMFDTNDSSNADLNFDDYDFGDNTGNQNHDFDSNGDVFDLSSFGNQDSTENGGTNSLLQALENFGDGSAGDFALLDSSNATGNQGVGENSGGNFEIGGNDIDMGLAMGNESAFDELLSGMDFAGGSNDTGGNTMEHGEFDDAFFGINNDP